ncbi:hypothetical protein KYY02_29085 [Streptomyces pimonensis]|uniref:Helix-turn-helix domain-containing protein n=1 Tax=Streptomyces pimonensis TaxID=2860288 RepID=A0ABV4J6P5_9ACTN
MPFNTAAAEVRTTIQQVLGSWAGLVRERRGVHPPSRAPKDTADFLLSHSGWLGRHVAAADLSCEISQLVHSALRIAEPVRVRRFKVGRCPEAACGGTLHARVHARALDHISEIQCDAAAEHQWTQEEWLHLKQRLATRNHDVPGGKARATAWLSPSDITSAWQISPGSVYRLASKQRWRRRNHGGRVEYDGTDVLRTMRQRDAPPA